MVPLEVDLAPSVARRDAARRIAAYAAVAIAAGLATLTPVSDGDIYWHLAAGRFMRSAHALLRVDPFTISASGRPWIDVHWLFQWTSSALYDLGGLKALAWAAAAAVATTAALVARTAERVGGEDARDRAVALVLAGLFAARHLVALRPVLVTLVAMALCLTYLERWRLGLDGRTRRWLAWLLPLVQLVWTNCQGLSYLGLGLMGAYGLGELITRRTKEAPAAAIVGRASRPAIPPSLSELGAVLAGCSVASLVTPYGSRAWLLPFALLGRLAPTTDNVFSLAVAENVPPFVLAKTTGQDPAHLLLALGLLACWLLLKRPRFAWGPGLVCVGLLGLGLVANRNILLVYLLAPALLATVPCAPLRLPRLFGSSRSVPAAVNRVLVAGIGLACLGLSFAARAQEPQASRPTPFRFPVEATRTLAAAHATGTIFAPDHQAGYLTFHVPGLRPYLDTRLVLHTGDEYAAYLAVLDQPRLFDELDARVSFDYVLSTTGLPGRYLALTSHLLGDPRWSLVATDGTEVLFARNGTALSLASEATRDAIRASLDRRFGEAPALRHAAYLNFARLLIAAGQPDAARDTLAAFGSRAAAWLRARALFAAGHLAGAETLTTLLLQQDPEDADGQALAASLHLARGHDEEGRAALAHAVKLEPFNQEARQLVARLTETGGAP